MAHRHEHRFPHEKAHLLDDPQRDAWFQPAKLIEVLGLKPGARIADVGAGTGYFALPFARAVAPGGAVIAVDVEPKMLQRLGERSAGLPIQLVEGEATRTGLPDASVDLVWLANVWHELDDTAAAVAEAARVVRPGGRVAVFDWRDDAPAEPGPPVAIRVPLAALRDALAQRLRIERAEPWGTYTNLVVARAA